MITGYFVGLKRHRREADHAFPFSVKFITTCRTTSTCLNPFIALISFHYFREHLKAFIWEIIEFSASSWIFENSYVINFWPLFQISHLLPSSCRSFQISFYIVLPLSFWSGLFNTPSVRSGPQGFQPRKGIPSNCTPTRHWGTVQEHSKRTRIKHPALPLVFISTSPPHYPSSLGRSAHRWVMAPLRMSVTFTFLFSNDIKVASLNGDFVQQRVSRLFKK
jgi:hypothetical protein